LVAIPTAGLEGNPTGVPAVVPTTGSSATSTPNPGGNLAAVLTTTPATAPASDVVEKVKGSRRLGKGGGSTGLSKSSQLEEVGVLSLLSYISFGFL
jgi:hypothetical protein